ncbi:hypothetical protein [Streptomyces sp. NPDC046939]|uniref:hypothetical protein n=1 Tax=Streptomyces sp. NPDC046939 TaxID=3155376 RepID=UPI0033D514CA
MQDEADKDHLHRRVLALSSVVLDPLDTTASAPVGTMIRDGYGYGSPDTCHALYCALPSAEFTGMSILLADDENENRYPRASWPSTSTPPACSASPESETSFSRHPFRTRWTCGIRSQHPLAVQAGTSGVATAQSGVQPRAGRHIRFVQVGCILGRRFVHRRCLCGGCR